MISLASLWLPILLSAVFVFAASSIIHMVLPYHRSDFGRLPDEEGVRQALRPLRIPPGEYIVPRVSHSRELKSPEYVKKIEEGPVAFVTVLPNRLIPMGSSLVQWFLYCAVVSVFAGYLTAHALGPDAHYLAVFRFAGGTAFLGYSLALVQNSIWYHRAWSITLKSVFDGLVYACVTAGTFGWLWPSA